MKIPYKMQAAVDVETRRQNMLAAIHRDIPRLEQQPIDESTVMHIACYGPSLRDTWQDIKHPCISMSGATRFLAERGFIPDYHIDMDPRAHKIKQLIPPVEGVTYLIASVCAPIYFDTLKDQKILIWHCVSSTIDSDLEWLSANDFDKLLVNTGSNIGLAAIQIGGILGARHFEVHGMDGSFGEDGARHAGEHFGKVQKPDTSWQSQGVKYTTTKIMANGVAEAINAMRAYPVFCVFHGQGLQQSLIEEENLANACTVRQTERAQFVRHARVHFPDYPIAPKAKNAWEAICFAEPEPSWLPELQQWWEIAEKRREKAENNTGSISLETGLLIRSVCAWRRPKVAIEVGTFIGKSTHALVADHIYTCDARNDCFPATDRIHTHPKRTSAEMFDKLLKDGVRAEVFFFDGRIGQDEVPMILELSAQGAVYLFDDYHGGPTGKGLANVKKLAPALKDYVLVMPYEPFKGRSTLAMLVPLHLGEMAA
jgi:hypothetical protein